MTKERTAPQSPEDMAKAAQEAAVKAAMEQAQSMFGNIPGFQMPEGMQEQIMTQMTAGIPNMEEIPNPMVKDNSKAVITSINGGIATLK